MEAAVAGAGALVATGFFAELVRSHLQRPRPHVAVWSAAIFMYAAATWALFAGLGFGWSDVNFRLFYWLGAITNVPFLALGAVFLVIGARAGGILLILFSAFGAGGGAATFGAGFVSSLPDSGVPAGSEVFASFVPAQGEAFSLIDAIASPRLWAVVGNTIGSMLLIGLALYTVVRLWGPNRRLATGNLLIVAGTVAPVLGGSLTAFGEGGGLAVSLLVGAALLWAGFRTSSRARRPATV